jgi:hypothetical protein
MFEFDTGQQKQGPIRPGLEAGGAWLGCMAIFTGLLWLSAQLPARPLAEEKRPVESVPAVAPTPPVPPAPPEEKAEPFGTDLVLPPKLLGDGPGCIRPSETEDVIPFGVGMTRPEFLSGPALVHTPEAREARVRGLIIAKCTVTCRGEVRSCRIIKPLPYMEQAALDVLHSRRYKPAHYLGRPVTVSYVFALRVEPPVDLPDSPAPSDVAPRP